MYVQYIYKYSVCELQWYCTSGLVIDSIFLLFLRGEPTYMYGTCTVCTCMVQYRPDVSKQVLVRRENHTSQVTSSNL